MSYKDELAVAGRFLRDNDHFLVVNHVNPDGDATGSLLAMGHLLKALGKRFTLANEGNTPKKFKFLPLGEQIKDYSKGEISGKYERVIALDCGDFLRLGALAECFSGDVQLLNIDHHPTNDRFGTFNVVRTDACATAEILYDLVMEMQIPLTKDLASALYMGLLTDTGGFRYSNTSAGVMKKAAELLEHGVSPAEMAERCLETITPSYIRLLQQVLPTLQMGLENKVAYLTISLQAAEQSQANQEDMEGIVNYARNIEGVEVGVLFKQVEADTVRVSLRSRKDIDVSQIAKALGGGGHARAAGCTIKGSLQDAQEAIAQRLQEAWRDKA